MEFKWLGGYVLNKGFQEMSFFKKKKKNLSVLSLYSRQHGHFIKPRIWVAYKYSVSRIQQLESGDSHGAEYLACVCNMYALNTLAT